MLTVTTRIGEGMRVGRMGDVRILGVRGNSVNMECLGEQRILTIGREEEIRKDITVKVRRRRDRKLLLSIGAPTSIPLLRTELCAS